MTKPLRVIVIGLGSAGDVHPNVGLALGLQRRGHRVLLVAPSLFRSLAERTGLEFAGLLNDEAWHDIVRDPNLWHPVRSFSVVARRLIVPMMRPIYEIIEKNRETGRTVVAASGITFGARFAQEKLGVRLATVHMQPAMLRSAIRPACFGFPDIPKSLPRPLRRAYFRAVDGLIIDPLLAGEANRFRAELGLPPVKRFLDRWAHSPELVIGLFPEWFAPAQPDWPPKVVLTGFPLWDEKEVRDPAPGLAEFLAAGERPIVFTAGSGMAQAKWFFRVSAEVCRASGRRGLLWFCGNEGWRLRSRRRFRRESAISITCRSAPCCRARRRWCIWAASGPPHKRLRRAFRN